MEQKIIEAAKATFLKKGFKDTNMADIAAEVGLTRPAMHYYFRTKERLFHAVFSELLMSFVPKIKDSITASASLEEKVAEVVDIYLSVLKESPELPLFIIREINRDMDNIVSVAIDNDLLGLGRSLMNAINREMEEGRMRKMPLIDLVYTFYGLMIVPFIANPLGTRVFRTDSCSEEFLKEWKENMIRQMVCLLTPEK